MGLFTNATENSVQHPLGRPFGSLAGVDHAIAIGIEFLEEIFGSCKSLRNFIGGHLAIVAPWPSTATPTSSVVATATATVSTAAKISATTTISTTISTTPAVAAKSTATASPLGVRKLAN